MAERQLVDSLFVFDSWAIFNLNGQYNTLSFVLGHVDGSDIVDYPNDSIEIYLDGKVAFAMDLNPEAIPERIEVPLYGAQQMKVVKDCRIGSYVKYALADIEIY